MNLRGRRDNGTSLSPALLDGRPNAPVREFRPLSSDALLGGQQRIEILHNAERYVLSLTRLGKLILTK